MRVAFVNQPWNRCPPVDSGSIAIWTHEVARRLAGHSEVVVYAGRVSGEPSRGREEGVEYRRFSTGLDRRLIRWLRRMPGRRASGRPLFTSDFFYLPYILRVARDLRRKPCDIVHIHNFAQFAPVVRFLNRRVRTVLHMHCDWLAQLDRRQLLSRLQRVDLVLGASEHVTLGAKRRLPEYVGRWKTVFNGVEVPEMTAGRPAEGASSAGPVSESPQVLLFVGRISPEKGLHVLLEAFEEVSRRHPAARLRVVGPAAMTPREYLVDLSEDPAVRALSRFYDGVKYDGGSGSYLAGLEESVPEAVAGRVEFPGPLPHSELADEYRRAAVLVNPSLSEAFGMSLIEAMAQRLPVVASRVGGMTEIVVDGETGLLVPPGDAGALAAALDDLLRDLPCRMMLGEAGRKRARGLFSWDRVSESLRVAYDELLSSRA